MKHRLKIQKIAPTTQKSRPEHFLIAQDGRARTSYLDGYDGFIHEWTRQKTKAWQFTNHTGHADRMLAKLKRVYKSACIVPAPKGK